MHLISQVPPSRHTIETVYLLCSARLLDPNGDVEPSNLAVKVSAPSEALQHTDIVAACQTIEDIFLKNVAIPAMIAQSMRLHSTVTPDVLRVCM